MEEIFSGRSPEEQAPLARSRRDCTPLARISLRIGRTLDANASAAGDFYYLAALHCCFESGSAFGSVERTIRAKKVSISYKLRGHDEGGRSGVAASGIPEPAVGSFSVGAVADVFSVDTAGLAAAVVSLAALSSSLGEVWPVAGDGGVSELPRMIGKPSLALPMITTFELLDCAS